ncbi:MAG: SIR2 family protein [Phycisphaerae bacterium]|nr:SIR2 family protein [Phycisphaerae bacterium]
MIDPLLSLALSMHAHPGTYAVLLGSGVSRSAGIPTGWEVVLDLIRRLAQLTGEDCEPDPEAWFTAKCGQQPTYSGLLDSVAKSQAERSHLLQGYFEPTDDEREQGLKIPTPAHHALARLVKSAHVKVIFTTNFDRLMEQALDAIGVAPTVISSPDAVEGAMPLVHSKCTLVKLHGDYRDLRTKNTPVELDQYDPRVDGLLDRVLDEFGVVTCGWSGEWDTALRRAFERCKSRRFTTYWAIKGPLNPAAKELVNCRAAEVLSIESADHFFPELAAKIEALSQVDQPHPLSAKVAVAQAKKYLGETRYRIQLHDLLMQDVERIVQQTSTAYYPVTGSFQNEDVAARIADFEAISATAVAVTATGCYWGGKEHACLWVEAINRLANPTRPQAWNNTMQGLRAYPALLLLYAGGITAIAGDHYETLFALLNKPKVRDNGRSEDLVTGLFDALKPDVFKVVPGLEKMKIARSVRLHRVLREPLREFLPDDETYERAFDRFEAVQSFWSADTTSWAIPGAFMYRCGRFLEGSVLAEIINERQSAGNDWGLFKIGFFGGKPERWDPALKIVQEMQQRISWM